MMLICNGRLAHGWNLNEMCVSFVDIHWISSKVHTSFINRLDVFEDSRKSSHVITSV